MAEILYISNDNLLELDGLLNAATGEYINSATVTVTLKNDETGDEVENQTWPTTLSYVTGSDGKYRATMNDELALVEKGEYTAYVNADGGTGLKGYWELPVVAQVRRS